MFFIGTPVIQSAEEAMRFKLSWPDFATHDPIKDVIVQHTIQTQQQHKHATSPDGEKEGGSGSGRGLPSSVSTSAISDLAASPAAPSGCPFSGGMNSGTTPVTVPPTLPSLAPSPSPKEHSKKKNVLQSLFGSKIPKGADGGLSTERRDSSNNLTSASGSKIAVPAPSEWKKSTNAAALGLPTHGNNSNENIPMLVSSSASPLNSLHSSGSYDTSSTSATLQPSSSSNGVASSSSGSHINFQPMQLSPSPSVEDRFTKKFHELMWEDACRGFHLTIDLLKHFHTSNDSYCEVTQSVFERVK